MRLIKVLWCLLMLCSLSMKGYSFDKVVIWGHKLHSHTHSYVHNAFYIAFTHLGYPTYWFDDDDDVSEFDFSHTLFLTEGQADHQIPIRDDCQYMLHNCSSPKYHTLPQKNWFSFQVYTDNVLSNPTLVKVASCIYYDLPGRGLFMPWATDLLPHQIDEIKKNIPEPQPYATFIGTIGGGRFGNEDQLEPFITACNENELQFVHRAAVSVEANMKLVGNSYIAPAIVGKWQKEVGYIPCRIFKNISYGKMGVTNSLRVSELFEGKIVYNPDEYQLFYDAKERIDNMSIEELYELMDLVRDKHTYLNRIQTLLNFLNLVETQFSK